MLVNQSIGFDSRVLGACGKKKMEQSAREFKTKVETVLARGRNEIYRPDLTKAAVLVPIVFRKNGPHIIVTMRSMKVETHKGRISFPGGVREPEDKNAVDNALRETQEEIGVDPDSVTVMGLLDDIVTSSGFKVTPVVGFVSSEVSYSKDSVEVEEIIEVPISFLRDPSKHEVVTMEYENICYRYHSFKYNGYDIWGVTGGIINGFIKALDASV